MRDYGKVCLTERIGVCVEDEFDDFCLIEERRDFGNIGVNRNVEDVRSFYMNEGMKDNVDGHEGIWYL